MHSASFPGPPSVVSVIDPAAPPNVHFSVPSLFSVPLDFVPFPRRPPPFLLEGFSHMSSSSCVRGYGVLLTIVNTDRFLHFLAARQLGGLAFPPLFFIRVFLFSLFDYDFSSSIRRSKECGFYTLLLLRSCPSLSLLEQTGRRPVGSHICFSYYLFFINKFIFFNPTASYFFARGVGLLFVPFQVVSCFLSTFVFLDVQMSFGVVVNPFI